MSINIRLRNIFYFFSIVFVLWFLYIERGVVAPFVIGMLFAYVFNPLITLLQKKFKVPRSVSILIVYILLIASGALAILFFARSFISESVSIRENFNALKTIIPGWLRPYTNYYIDSLSRNQLIIANGSSFPIFSRAFSGFLNIFIFLFSAFFFLKDNEKMLDRVSNFVPQEYKGDFFNLVERINDALSGYLRGQIILIASMIIMLMICFTFLGVKYSVTISILSALFEIVPIMGPIVAGILGTIIIAVSGGIHNFELTLIQTVVIIGAVYYVTRQLQDYIIAPYVIGKVTKLHPLVILFSVLAGEHLYGILGVLLAVPAVATGKIVYEFVTEKIREKDKRVLKAA